MEAHKNAKQLYSEAYQCPTCKRKCFVSHVEPVAWYPTPICEVCYRAHCVDIQSEVCKPGHKDDWGKYCLMKQIDFKHEDFGFVKIADTRTPENMEKGRLN